MTVEGEQVKEVNPMRSREVDCGKDNGQAVLEYALVLGAVAVPLIWAVRHLQDQVAAFIGSAVNWISLWSIGSTIY